MLPTPPKRDIALTIRVSSKTQTDLKSLAKKHNLSQADVIEHLVAQEVREMKRLKGKSSRYKRN